ncbi:uncharacterized protein LOC126968688 isoform X2 [Leptidea sinapis]|nr:uncharacterized protein LOC126968688 isoform X2 [Leptidea sinapis]
MVADVVQSGARGLSAVEADAVAEAEAEAGEIWPHRLTQAQTYHTYNNEAENAPHIFSHQGGLVQTPHRVWQPPAPAPGLDLEGAAGAGVEGQWSRGGEWVDTVQHRAWPPHRLPPPQPQPPHPEAPAYLGENARTMPELPIVYSGAQGLRDAPKKGFELISEPARPAAPRVPPPQPPQAPPAPRTLTTLVESTTKKKIITQTEARANEQQVSDGDAENARLPEHGKHVGNQAYAANAVMADDHDGLSEPPPAALMLLVLGTLVSTVLGVLLGARVRAVRRRRPRPRHALDADYLVNGMYL